MFPAHCFRQRTHLAEGHVNRDPVRIELTDVGLLNGLVPYMLSEESNKLEIYTYVRKIQIILKEI